MSISVPQAVKEALQDGRMRKNYRFKVYRQEDYDIWSEVASGITNSNKYTVTTAGKYKAENVDTLYLYREHPSSQGPSVIQTYETHHGVAVVDSASVNDLLYPGNNSTGCTIYFYEGIGQRWVYDTTLDNDKLVSESVSFDERMCSGSTLKFGLCEGTSLEFQYFNYENINGCRIEAFIDVYYGEAEPYEIPMGWFDVVQCPVQASTGIRKVTAYNKLRSSYLDSTKQVSALIEEGEDGITGSISVHKLLEEILAEDSIQDEPTYEEITNITRDTTVSDGKVFICNASGGGYLRVIYGTVYLYDVNHDTTGYYRYIIDDKGMWDNVLGSIVLSGYYVSTQSGIVSLETYIKNGAALSAAMGGYIVVDNTSSEQIYRSFPPFSRSHSRRTATREMTNHSKVGFVVPLYVNSVSSQGSDTPTYAEIQSAANNFLNNINPAMLNYFHIEKSVLNALEEVRLTSANSQDVTIRELQSAAFEVSCQFGKLDRVTDLFSGVTLNYGRLLPASSLYPANTLYPAGSEADTNPSHYQQLWTDDGGTDKFKYLIITYKSGDSEAKLQRTVHSDGTVNYNMSDNWLLKNLSWTAEQVGEIADAMVPLMRNISWFPFEMWAPGLPYLETGDEIEIETPNGTYTSYILQRTLKGIQNLMDTYISGELDTF